MSNRPLRFFNMYLTTTISVSLVLVLIGLLGTLMLATNSLVNRVKENMAVTIVLSDEADEGAINGCTAMLKAAPYCRSFRFISREEALQEHIDALGEDPSKFLGYNPLSNSIEMHPTATYAHPDSIAAVEQSLLALPYVSRLIYQQDVLDMMSTNTTKMAWGIVIIAAILLLIALALIANTIRLQIYAKRFLIRTMSLVGATSWMIRAPFVRRNVLIGLAATLLASIFLGGAIYYVQFHLGIHLFDITYMNMGFLLGIMLCSSLLITTITACVSTGRYLRMNADTLYRI